MVEFGGIQEPPLSRHFHDKQSPPRSRLTPTITHANVRPSTSLLRKEVGHTDWTSPAPKRGWNDSHGISIPSPAQPKTEVKASQVKSREEAELKIAGARGSPRVGRLTLALAMEMKLLSVGSDGSPE
jgi:hypothetical protein